MPTASLYRLVRTRPAPVVAPELDASQRLVVDHDHGPMLVLAGPGTGKTTTLVEAVVERVRAGLDPQQVLVLTFSRKAAEELRERITLRLGRTVTEPAAHTFHGFCYAVVRRYGTVEGRLPRLLSAAERELRIRELLAGHADGIGATRWPAELMPALRLRGFAREVADVVDRARERGIDPALLARLGHEHGRPEWVSGAQFLAEYLDVLDLRGEIDYAGLVGRASDLLDGDAAELTTRFGAVYVDEYQDTDPSQEDLLERLAGRGRLLVAVGDPDQSIYGFRGADVGGIMAFPERFPHADGSPATIATLAVCRRSGPELLAVSRAVAERLPLGPLTRRRGAHRGLQPAGPSATVAPEIALYPSAAAEVGGIADLLRRAHLEDGVGWADMAVLVRSGVRSIPVMRRGLVLAGVPVVVAADEQPLGRDPAVAPLLAALGLVVRRDQLSRLRRLRATDVLRSDHADTADAADLEADIDSTADLDAAAVEPEVVTGSEAQRDQLLDVDEARLLLLSPLAGATPSALRSLGRALRAAERDGGRELPPPSATLLRDAVLDPRSLTLLADRDTAPVRRLAVLVEHALAVVRADGTPEEVLWALWSGSGWDQRLADRSMTGGASGRAAGRDLDAVLALFDVAARLQDRQPRATVAGLLEEVAAAEIPAGTDDDRGVAADAVRLLTAHRSKGLEWDLVVVSGVQDGVWPDLRQRGSVLGADALDLTGPRPAPTAAELTVEERRLFYVALTRARRRLVVTAVSAVDDLADRPSRFLAETGLAVPTQTRAPTGLLSVGSLVARLRRAATSPASTRELRAAAGTELARLAAATDDENDEPLVPAADPQAWWGRSPLSVGPRPVRGEDRPVALSGSAVSEVAACPRRWFLSREVHAAEPSTAAQGFGQVIHALAEAVASGAMPAQLEPLLERLDSVWSALAFEAGWQRARERDDARAALLAFLSWHRQDTRTLVGAERSFEVTLGDDVVLRGRADRVELDDHGRVVVVDLKTGRTTPTTAEVAENPQLGVYQLAVREGAFAEIGTRPGGAELLQLRSTTSAGAAKVQPQPALDPDVPWIDDLVADVATAVRAENFPARPSVRCDRCAFRTSCPAHDAGGQVVP